MNRAERLRKWAWQGRASEDWLKHRYRESVLMHMKSKINSWRKR